MGGEQPPWHPLRSAAGHIAVLAASLLALTSVARPKAIHSIAGPYRFMPRRIEHCPPELEARVPLVFHVRGVRDRKELDRWYYSGNFTTNFTWTNDHQADLNFASWSSRGGWKDNYYIIKVKKFCTAFKMYAPEAYKAAMIAINNTTDYTNCTWAPGTYFIRNLTTNFDVKAIPVLFYGKWRLTMRLMDNGFKDTVGCVRVFVDTIPKLER